MDAFEKLMEQIQGHSPSSGLHLVEGTVVERVRQGVPTQMVEVAGTDQERDRLSGPEGFTLHKGDRLLLLTDDWQHFYIMYKVVQL